MGRYQGENSYPAGEATPVQITDSTLIPTLPVQKFLGNSRTYTDQYQHTHNETPSTYVQSHSLAQPHPRPCSSWYSQPSICHSSFSHSRSSRPTSPPPLVPRLTSTALRSLEQRLAVHNDISETGDYRYQSGSDPWQHPDGEDDHDNEAVSPTSTSTRMALPTRRVSVDAYLSAAKRTAVSEYLRDRTWLPPSPSFPQSHSPPLPVGLAITTDHDGFSAVIGRRRSTPGSISEIAKQVARKASVSSSSRSGSLSRSQTRKGSKSDNRKGILTARPDRHRSGVAARPYLLRADSQEFVSGYEYERGCEHGFDRLSTRTDNAMAAASAGQGQGQSSLGRSRKPSLATFMSPSISFGTRKLSLKESVLTPSVPRSSSNSAVNGNKKAAVVLTGHRDKDVSPLIGVPYEKSRIGPSPIHISTIRTIGEGKNSVQTTHQRPCASPPARHHAQPSRIITTPNSATSRQPPAHRTYPTNLPCNSHLSKPLKTQTRDPLTCSNEGAYLFIGTLHGPTPSGLRSLHSTMDRAIMKHGEVEGKKKGCKEVRKWLRYEERGVIEWVLGYVRGRWGVEV